MTTLSAGERGPTAGVLVAAPDLTNRPHGVNFLSRVLLAKFLPSTAFETDRW